MRRRWIILAACLVLAACGDDGDAGGDGAESGSGAPSDEFCATLEPLAEVDLLANPTAEELMLLEEARAAAPEDLQPAFDELIAVTEVFLSPDPQLEDLERFDEETQRQASADLVAAAEACGVDVPVFVYEGGGDGGDDGTAAARDRYESDDLRAAVEAADPAFEGNVDFITRVNDTISFQIAGLTGADQAVVACEAAVAYLDGIDYQQAELRVTDSTDTEFATRAAGEDCVAA